MNEKRDVTARGFRNELFAPITDPYYADSLALHEHMSSYDYIISQPIVLNEEQAKRFREIMEAGPKPLPGDKALPIEGEDA